MPFKQQVKKYLKKQGKRVLNYGKKRYFKGSQVGLKNLKVGQVIKDVARLKSMVNAEKKRYDFNFGQFSVAQFKCNSAGTNLDTGNYVQDITPSISEGLTISSRNGSSIKLHSAVMKFQFSHMTNTSQNIKVRIIIFQVKGTPITWSSTELAKFYDPNPITFFTDYNALRNPDNYNNYKIIKTKTVYMKEDSLSSQTLVKDVQINLRLNHHIRYDKDTTTLRQGQMFIMMVADNGNNGSATATTGFLGATPPVLTNNSGLYCQANIRYYYYDN